ncbi:MAG: hypothetical protein FD165_2354 [Gammaproteobacteria bacterium]|nr:MAG: hypothetical protein FD165_2354 [Gammaproteobacteria bacterium]TND01426.1 MAG: hypothetical protein FD120_2599 [Gammaproteobacteria bacterium]
MQNPLARCTGAYLLVCLFCTTVHAEPEPGNAGPVIHLNEAIASTLARNPALVGYGYQLEAQGARVQQAALPPNPELELTVENALGSGKFAGIDSAETTLSIAWILERGARQRRVDTARAGSALLAAEADVMRVDAAAETARRFVACLAGQARMANADEAVQLARETVEAIRQRVTAGRSAHAELARAQAEQARTELRREDIEHELLSAIHRLAAQWGETEPAFTRVSGDLLLLPRTTSFDSLATRIEQNPDFARFLSKQRLDDALLRLAEAERKPDWRVSAGVRRLAATDDQALVAGISMPLTLRNQNQGGIAAARAQAAGTEADTAAARVSIRTSLFVMHQELEHALHRTRTLRDDVIPHIELALAEMQRGYEHGRYSYFEWRSVQTELLEARSDLVEAIIDAHLRIIELERLTGQSVTQQPTSR